MKRTMILVCAVLMVAGTAIAQNGNSNNWRATADSDGGHPRQVTRLGAASFAPSFHPDGHRVIFATNYPDPRSRNFDLYLVDLDGRGLERVTTSGEFDGFPMFSPDGRRLVFASNRHGKERGETDIFITPGYQFRVVDALLTNFHLPQSTLMMLVSAFAGMETIRTAYREAIAERYRFFSYCDCMFLAQRGAW